MVVGYKIHNTRTGETLPKVYKNRQTANKAVDRRNQEYGAYAWVSKPVYAESEGSNG